MQGFLEEVAEGRSSSVSTNEKNAAARLKPKTSILLSECAYRRVRPLTCPIGLIQLHIGARNFALWLPQTAPKPGMSIPKTPENLETEIIPWAMRCQIRRSSQEAQNADQRADPSRFHGGCILRRDDW